MFIEINTPSINHDPEGVKSFMIVLILITWTFPTPEGLNALENSSHINWPEMINIR